MTNMTSRHHLRAGLALLAAAGLALLGACGGTAASGAEGAAPKAGDVLRLALSRQLTNIHPHKGGSPDSQGAVIGSIYESLTRISPDFKVVPGLASSWKAVDDLDWQFTIRTDARYSDGNALTADDIVWNFQQLLDPKYPGTSGAPLRKYLKSVEKQSDTTLAFHLSQPALDLPGRLWNIYIVEPSFAKAHKLDTEALGSGPYKLDSLDLENGATLSLNPSYAGPKPAFAKVKYTVLASEAQRIAALKAGEQDIVLNLAPLSQEQFKDSEVYDTILGVGPQPLVLALNERKKDTPLANAQVRQALNYATDKQTIIHGLLKDSVKPLPGQVIYEPTRTTWTRRSHCSPPPGSRAASRSPSTSRPAPTSRPSPRRRRSRPSGPRPASHSRSPRRRSRPGCSASTATTTRPPTSCTSCGAVSIRATSPATSGRSAATTSRATSAPRSSTPSATRR
jgi:peptide/nickel transport system substrate-binding protein